MKKTTLFLIIFLCSIWSLSAGVTKLSEDTFEIDKGYIVFEQDDIYVVDVEMKEGMWRLFAVYKEKIDGKYKVFENSEKLTFLIFKDLQDIAIAPPEFDPNYYYERYEIQTGYIVKRWVNEKNDDMTKIRFFDRLGNTWREWGFYNTDDPNLFLHMMESLEPSFFEFNTLIDITPVNLD